MERLVRNLVNIVIFVFVICLSCFTLSIPAISVPHSPQNLAFGLNSDPQLGQIIDSFVPHSSQNLAPARFSYLHFGHCMATSILSHKQSKNHDLYNNTKGIITFCLYEINIKFQASFNSQMPNGHGKDRLNDEKGLAHHGA